MTIVAQGYGSLATGGVSLYNIGEIEIESREVTVVTDTEVNINLQLICE
jgi:hypothetical protein